MNRANDPGRQRPHTTGSPGTATASRITPGQPRFSHVTTTVPTTTSTSGWRRTKPMMAASSRQSWTMAMIQPGVWNTGERQIGGANGSGLLTWVIWSPENVDIFTAPPPRRLLRRRVCTGWSGTATRRRPRCAPRSAQVGGHARQQAGFPLVVGDLVGQGRARAELAGVVEQFADLRRGDPAGLIGHDGGPS